jgi:hypothetical protein
MSLKCKLFLKKVLKNNKTRVKIKLNKMQFDANSADHAVYRRAIFSHTSNLYLSKKLNFVSLLTELYEK